MDANDEKVLDCTEYKEVAEKPVIPSERMRERLEGKERKKYARSVVRCRRSESGLLTPEKVIWNPACRKCESEWEKSKTTGKMRCGYCNAKFQAVDQNVESTEISGV